MSFFDLEHVTSLHDISPGAKIHIIGVCGVAMGALALSLEKAGYQVSGSDKEFYPPISVMLESSSIKLFRGYSAENIASDIDLVVIGNSALRTNPEVEVVQQRNLPHTFFAKIAGELLLDKRKSIVIAGTHGKTTTTSLMAYGLRELKRDPSYFIGGKVAQLGDTFYVGSGGEGVIEGDEYDSVFYVKRPKFLFYRPDILVVNALEFDHADIYSDLGAIEKEFDELLERVPDDGVIVACIDFKPVRELLERYKKKSARVVTFGESEDATYRMTDIRSSENGSEATVLHDEENFSLSSSLHGAMNLRNVLATTIVAEELQITPSEWIEALRSFSGVSRRLEVRYKDDKLVLLEDFAHHPTAVKEVIRTLKASYPDALHWVAFEPRSNTSRRNIFQKEYGESFAGIDRLFLREITTRPSDEGQDLMDVPLLMKRVGEDGVQGEVLRDGKVIAERVLELVKTRDEKVVITIMSNGGFDGLPGLLAEGLKK